MLVLLHVIIAMSSIVYTAYVFFAPSAAKLRVSYSLVALTLATGTYLVYSTHSPLLSSCLTGLVYLAIVLFEIVVASKRLARERIRSEQ